MVKLVQIASLLFVLMGCFMLFLYSPFYSKMMVKLLNTFVPVEVDQVAAQSQKMAALNESETFEPGSDLWIARQAYLKVMEQELKENKSKNLTLIQTRYKLLQQSLMLEQALNNDDSQIMPLRQDDSASSAVAESAVLKELMAFKNDKNKELMQEYMEFLNTHEVTDDQQEGLNLQTIQDAQSIQDKDSERAMVQLSKPYAIVVLGGGLTLDKDGKTIVVNEYTRLRLEKTLELESEYHLPIVLSGVEAPYMQKWLLERGIDAKLLEDRSMNTCENTRFSSLLLQKKGGAPTVMLVTDEYHMPRTRRLFALNGIETIPVESPMPTKLTHWRPSEKNYDHSRRANYEMLASVRDVLFGSSDCREIP